MKFALFALFVLAGCAEEPFRCTPRLYVVTPSAEYFWCGPDTHVRIEAGGDGQLLRSLVVCDCDPPRPRTAPTVDGGSDAGRRVWR